MERRRFIIPMVIMASIVGIVVFVFFMFYKNVFIFKSQDEVQVSSAVPTAAAVYCSCGGIMSRTEYTAPTCTTAGSETLKCNTCEKTITAELPALGHPEVEDPAVAATCTQNGLTEGSHCSRCGEVFEEQEVVPAFGHDLTYVAAVEPAEDSDGNIEYWYCETCGKYFSDENAATEIEQSEIVVSYSDGMPLWQILLAVASGILLFGVVAVLLDKFVFNADTSGGK